MIASVGGKAIPYVKLKRIAALALLLAAVLPASLLAGVSEPIGPAYSGACFSTFGAVFGRQMRVNTVAIVTRLCPLLAESGL